MRKVLVTPLLHASIQTSYVLCIFLADSGTHLLQRCCRATTSTCRRPRLHILKGALPMHICRLTSFLFQLFPSEHLSLNQPFDSAADPDLVWCVININAVHGLILLGNDSLSHDLASWMAAVIKSQKGLVVW